MTVPILILQPIVAVALTASAPLTAVVPAVPAPVRGVTGVQAHVGMTASVTRDAAMLLIGLPDHSSSHSTELVTACD